MPNDNDPAKKNDPQSSPAPATVPATAPPAGDTVAPPLWSFTRPLGDGTLNGRVRPQDTRLDGSADYLFNNGDKLGANLLLNTQPWAIERYGANADFGLGRDGRLNGSFLHNRIDGNTDYALGANFLRGDYVNLNLKDGRQGSLFTGDGKFVLGKGDALTANAEVNGIDKTSDFKLGGAFERGDAFNLRWRDTQDGSIFNGDGKWIVGKGDTLTGSAEVDRVNKTSDFKLGGNFDDQHLFNLNYNNSEAGSVLKADGKATVGKGDTLAGRAEVNGIEKTQDYSLRGDFANKDYFSLGYKQGPTGSIFKADGSKGLDGTDVLTGSAEINRVKRFSEYTLGGKFDRGDFFNLNLRTTPEGSIFKGDGRKTFGKDDTLTGSFNVNGIDKTSAYTLGGKFGNGDSFNFDLNGSRNGSILKGDGLKTIGSGNTLTAGFDINGVEKTRDFRLGAKFDNDDFFNLSMKATPKGALLHGDGQKGFGKGDTLTGSFDIDRIQRTNDFRLGGKFDGGDVFNINVRTTPNGSIVSGDGQKRIGQDGSLTGSFLLNQPDSLKEFKLGGSFANGNKFNVLVGDSAKGPTFGADATWNYDRGRGSVMLDGKYSRQFSEAGATVVYRDNGLEYGGNVRFDNQRGKFDLSSLGANIAVVNDRHRFGFDASWKPQTKDYSVGLTYTFSFGGGSRRSSPAPSMPDLPMPPVRPIETAAQRDEKSIGQLSTQGRKLYEQAMDGVERLNAQGANLPLRQTSAALAMSASEKGLTRIDQVFLGNADSDGKRNLFVADGDPTKPQTRSASMDRDLAASTSVQFSVAKINHVSAGVSGGIEQNAAGQKQQGDEPALQEAVRRGV